MTAQQNVPGELTAAQVMTDQKANFLSDGLREAGVTMADMDRGFTAETLHEDGMVDADGTNHVGNPYERAGFAGPNSKYKRL